jgi:hypothetical protein
MGMMSSGIGETLIAACTGRFCFRSLSIFGSQISPYTLVGVVFILLLSSFLYHFPINWMIVAYIGHVCQYNTCLFLIGTTAVIYPPPPSPPPARLAYLKL